MPLIEIYDKFNPRNLKLFTPFLHNIELSNMEVVLVQVLKYRILWVFIFSTWIFIIYAYLEHRFIRKFKKISCISNKLFEIEILQHYIFIHRNFSL